ncbi:YggS family pyridoxal phosphate-dependent enzyme [Thalassotalea maritima]|uniref:YggS family pyridoxal phosphate-dependent enzyme n=1 Tax=Thalassotalea maritima TaxID=3242416 RepID=UPI0035286FA1
MTLIADNLSNTLTQIQQYTQRAKRDVNSVTLLAVSKTKPIDDIKQAYQAGQRQFGENYVQELAEKASALQNFANQDIVWHFIGPIQSNKSRLVAEHAHWVHTIDRIKIAKRLNDQRDSNITPLQVCLQVNISGEDSKSGVTAQQISELAQYVNDCPQLTLRGLMCIPEKGDSRDSFLAMQTLFNQLKSQYPTVDTLSMGMSGDIEQAITCGSTMVRIGTAIFGSRT